MNKVIVALLIIVSGLHLWFALATNLYFSQDDFAVLAYFKSHSISEMTSTFLSVGDMWRFHKIIGYWFLKITFNLFSTNPLPYILLNHIFHTINVILVAFLVWKLTRSNIKTLISGLLFNKIYLLYFSNIHEYLVTCLCLSVAVIFLRKSKSPLVWLLVVLAVLTKEVGVTSLGLLLSLCLWLEISWKEVLTSMSVCLIYILFQINFIFRHTNLVSDHPYLINGQILERIKYYFPTIYLVFPLIAVWLKKQKSIGFLITAGVALLPALLLVNRHELYYLYLPWAYFCIWLGIWLPKINSRTVFLYIFVIWIFGGRAILPPLAKHTYINWQKESIQQVVEQVGKALSSNPASVRIVFKQEKLERDAQLMLGSGVIDLFLPKVLANKYNFKYNLAQHVLEVVEK